MSFTFRLSTKAFVEYYDAYEWYEEQLSGLGVRFEKAIENQINLIISKPLHYPEKRKGYRESVVKDFPYLIVYRINNRDQIIHILSIFHTSRHPIKKLWRK